MNDVYGQERELGSPPVMQASKREQSLIVASRCRDCNHCNFPASGVCPACMSLAVDAVSLSGEGHLYSFTTAQRDGTSWFVGYVDLLEQVRIFARLSGYSDDAPPRCDELVRLDRVAIDSTSGAHRQRFVFARAEQKGAL